MMATSMENTDYEANNCRLTNTTTVTTAIRLRSLLRNAEENLRRSCARWADLQTSANIPEEVLEEIFSATGKAHLLISKKMAQFGSLIDDHEFGRGERPTSSTDLEGFWDMISIQIKEVSQMFEGLEECRRNSWMRSDIADIEATLPLKRSFKKTPRPMTPILSDKASKSDVSSARKHIQEARKRLASSDGRLENVMERHDFDNRNLPMHTPNEAGTGF